MSEDDLIQEIKGIYLFLTEQEPTPDDEIEAREKLINYFKALKPINSNADIDRLIMQALNKLENWDTLDLWFKEVKGMSKKISDFINSFEQKALIAEPEIEPKIDANISTEINNKQEVSQINITEIVSKVSEQFNQEISSLKEKIAPGEFVILDQFIDFTRRREVSFYKNFEKGNAKPGRPDTGLQARANACGLFTRVTKTGFQRNYCC